MAFPRKWLNSKFKTTYRSWIAMKARCTQPNHKDYYNYGGRGIKVCDRWLNNYDAFFEDMGEKPPKLTLDRINVNGNYEPHNCRWATITQQANNRRDNHKMTINGETKNISEWSNEKGIKRLTLRYRESVGMSPAELFSNEKLKPKNYSHLKNLSRKDNVIINFNNQSLTIAKWAEKTGLRPDTIWHRIHDSKMSIHDALTKTTDRHWNHGTNTGYSTYKCRCVDCTEFNRKKGQRARYIAKLKQGGL